jgi:hypothetical protein
MENDMVDKIITSPQPVKSVMWYVGYIIAAGLAGVTVMLFRMGVIFV